jgi:hypothetical protein
MNADTANIENIVIKCVATYNQTKTEWIDLFYSIDAQWIEYPSISFPEGRMGDIEALRRATETQYSLFPDRKMKIVNQISEGNKSVVELEWQGTTSRKIGNLEPGTVVKIRISSFFIIKGGKFIKQTDYIIPFREL